MSEGFSVGNFSAEEIADRIEGELRAVGTAERAEAEKAYMKSALEHIGVTVPAMRRITRLAVRGLDRATVLALVEELWASGVFELRSAAVEALIARAEVLETGDVAVAERLIRDARMWVYVDALAVKVVGELLYDDHAPLDRWAEDEEFWIRRSALLALLPGVRDGDPDLARISAYGELMIGEKEFFLRKALGWTLREVAKKRPGWVREWVADRIDTVSGVTIREAVKPLPERDANELMAAYRSR
ncbi:DNA alkylation repair protein [Actinocorallia lasiicapitis]